MLYILSEESPISYFTDSSLRFMQEERAKTLSGAFKAKIIKKEVLVQWLKQREEFVPVWKGIQYRRTVISYLETSYEEWCKVGINHEQIQESEEVFRFEREIPYEIYVIETDDIPSLTKLHYLTDNYYYAGEQIKYALAYEV